MLVTQHHLPLHRDQSFNLLSYLLQLLICLLLELLEFLVVADGELTCLGTDLLSLYSSFLLSARSKIRFFTLDLLLALPFFFLLHFRLGANSNFRDTT